MKKYFDFINRMGIELEGAYEDLDDQQKTQFHGDGSVHINNNNECDGSCREECYCYDECECENCEKCDQCDRYCQNCNCDDCMICGDCINSLDDCNCEIERCDKCKKKEIPCDECQTNFTDNQPISYNCNTNNHLTYQCDRDCDCECECECNCNVGNYKYIGELVSEPLPKTELIKWIGENYPDEMNETCGSHIHISLKSKLDYSYLMEKEFYTYFKNKMLQFGEINRIKPKSDFFRFVFPFFDS